MWSVPHLAPDSGDLARALGMVQLVGISGQATVNGYAPHVISLIREILRYRYVNSSRVLGRHGIREDTAFDENPRCTSLEIRLRSVRYASLVHQATL